VKLGAYTACLHDRPLPDALAVLAELGPDSAKINSGGFLPAPHLPIADVRSSADARAEYLGQFAAAGITLTALNRNGNPLHPDPEVRDKHGRVHHRRTGAAGRWRSGPRRTRLGPGRRPVRRERATVPRPVRGR
jgi:sugar phosphate isomerase/epimerase